MKNLRKGVFLVFAGVLSLACGSQERPMVWDCAESKPSDYVSCMETSFIATDSEVIRQHFDAMRRIEDRARVPEKERRERLLQSAKQFMDTLDPWSKYRDGTCNMIAGLAEEDSKIAYLNCAVRMNYARIQELKSLPPTSARAARGAP
jgi:uncharacterized protein YecT (DUF1311 family)